MGDMTPQMNLIIVTLFAGGVVISNFLDFIDSIAEGNWQVSLRQLFNLVGILALIWIHYFAPLVK